ncbi:MAG TPA: hypothetical protein VLI54_02440 [Bacillota bacterium]|nr:hypothetical protein [Bacillota bacterium]
MKSLELPNRSADFATRKPLYKVQIWRPTADEDYGLLRTVSPDLPRRERRHQLHIAAEHVSRMQDHRGRHLPFMHHVGLVWQESGIGSIETRMSLPGVATANNNLDHLHLPADRQAPRLTAYPGAKFAPLEQVEEMKDTGRLLVSDDPTGVVWAHDLAVHALTAQIFFSPNVIDRLQDRATKVGGDLARAVAYADVLEKQANVDTLGRQIAAACNIEARQQRDHDVTDRDVDGAWRYAGAMICRIVGDDYIGEPRQRWGDDLRQQCQALGDASLAFFTPDQQNLSLLA